QRSDPEDRHVSQETSPPENIPLFFTRTSSRSIGDEAQGRQRLTRGPVGNYPGRNRALTWQRHRPAAMLGRAGPDPRGALLHDVILRELGLASSVGSMLRRTGDGGRARITLYERPEVWCPGRSRSLPARL